MSKYHLTEAYGNLYNPRKADETFYENLRFVDYLMQEEIEEVMESLLWEFMDYGNTLDESYSLIEGVFSDDVILEEVISEAYEDRYPELKKQAAKAKQVAKSARREARKAAVTGALKKAYDTVKTVATGAGRAAMGGLRTAKSMAGTAYDRSKTKAGEAQAGLTKLVRKGASKVSDAARGGALKAVRAGGRMERAGKAAKTTYTVGAERGGKPVGKSVSVEVGGAKRRALGKVLRRAGAAVYRAMSGGKKGTETGGTTRVTPALPAAGQTSGKPHVSRRTAVASRSGGTMPRSSGPAFAQLPPVGVALRTSGPNATGNIRPESQRIEKMAKETSAGKKRMAKLNNEDYELLAQYILEDFINEGYADTYEDAFEILENLSESSIVELTEMYLED